MSAGWSWYVILLVVSNIIGCTALLWWTSKKAKGNEGTSHIWDGDITEYDKPLPRWWINLFYITIVFSIAYMFWYGGFGSYNGFSSWTSQSEHATQKAAGDARLAEAFRPYDGKPIDELARDAQAVALGRSIFTNQCATCHGSAGQGAIGYPNLTDTVWHWGGTPADILQTVLHGRNAVMPSWSEALTAMGGANAVEDVTTYVLWMTDPSLAATNGDAIARGRGLYANVCAACHGADGKGMTALGAPDLTDDYWLYGRSRAAIREGIERGRNGSMPAQEGLLGETRSRLAAAYVWTLSQQ